MDEVVDVVRLADGPTITEAADAEQNKAMGILAYLGILVLVPILAAKDSPFAKFHANQGLVLFIAEVVLAIVPRFLPSLVRLLLWGITGPLHIVILVFAIMGIISAANGQKKPLPLIGGIKLLT